MIKQETKTRLLLLLTNSHLNPGEDAEIRMILYLNKDKEAQELLQRLCSTLKKRYDEAHRNPEAFQRHYSQLG